MWIVERFQNLHVLVGYGVSLGISGGMPKGQILV
jgi:hypothetical protein